MVVSVSPLQACQGQRLGPLIQQLRDSNQATSGGGRLRFLAADQLGRVTIVGRWTICATIVLIEQQRKLGNGILFSRIAKKLVAVVLEAASAYVIVMVIMQDAQLVSSV